jgi:hypothetical protein
MPHPRQSFVEPELMYEKKIVTTIRIASSLMHNKPPAIMMVLVGYKHRQP